MLGVWVAAVADVGGEVLDRIAHVARQLRITPQELRAEAIVQTQKVVQHEHLSVAVRPCADADRGDVKCSRDNFGQCAGHELEHE